MVGEALNGSHPESCLVIPDLSKHDLLQFYTAAFTGSLDSARVRSIRSVASTLALHRVHWDNQEEEEEEEDVPVMKCLKKSDKIKLSQYFQPQSEAPSQSSLGANTVETLLRPFSVSSVECQDCGRRFSGVAQLESHRNMVHRWVCSDQPLGGLVITK